MFDYGAEVVGEGFSRLRLFFLGLQGTLHGYSDTIQKRHTVIGSAGGGWGPAAVSVLSYAS